jgi:hypothetical protein
MSSSYVGGCACGAVRYEIDDKPIFENHCHCRDCRRRSGTGHGSYLTFPDRTKAKVTGEARAWRVAADNGNVKTHSFCPTCGTPVYLQFTATPELFTIPAGSLDAPELFKPSAVTYNVRALEWDALDARLTKFEKMPQA